MAGANLTGANLTGADLTDANLTVANMRGATCGAYLTDANLADAYHGRRGPDRRWNLADAKNVPTIPPAEVARTESAQGRFQTHEERKAQAALTNARPSERSAISRASPRRPGRRKTSTPGFSACRRSCMALGRLRRRSWLPPATTIPTAGAGIGLVHLAGKAGYDLRGRRRGDSAIAGEDDSTQASTGLAFLIFTARERERASRDDRCAARWSGPARTPL